MSTLEVLKTDCYLCVSFDGVSQVTFNLGAILVCLTSHLQLVSISNKYHQRKSEDFCGITKPLKRHSKADLWRDPGASIRQRVWEGDQQLSSMSIITIVVRAKRIRGHVCDGDFQHNQTLVCQRKDLHIVLIPSRSQRGPRKKITFMFDSKLLIKEHIGH